MASRTPHERGYEYDSKSNSNINVNFINFKNCKNVFGHKKITTTRQKWLFFINSQFVFKWLATKMVNTFTTIIIFTYQKKSNYKNLIKVYLDFLLIIKYN